MGEWVDASGMSCEVCFESFGSLPNARADGNLAAAVRSCIGFKGSYGSPSKLTSDCVAVGSCEAGRGANRRESRSRASASCYAKVVRAGFVVMMLKTFGFRC